MPTKQPDPRLEAWIAKQLATAPELSQEAWERIQALLKRTRLTEPPVLKEVS